ncbi:neural cell adhesion molecule L1 isoform X1 [Rhineura floridana]|uniref:neural cell adhesion molecule L1 isoform X1 n=1 Tax=Rhineura floridana TaxID=261503 RepID=UPI002AC849BB|nr:neural cell adhesion molecule L1 isoform X1 [Rhineura floridana]
MASTPPCLLMLWPLVLLLCEPATSIEFPKGLQQPPEFTEQPEKKIVVFPTDEVTLKCEATGNPLVTFRWTKDGREFHPQDMPGMMQRNGGGTLIITTNNGNAATKFRGLYRCYASNIQGTAMSSESEIIAESAPQWPKEKVAPITVEEGTHTVLPCNPPASAVSPKIYWLNSKIEHITQDERVTMGQDGNLYFANVQMKDSRPDYICNAHFQGPRIIIQKEPIELKVFATNTFLHQKPILIVPNKKSSTYVAQQGKALVLECIVAGLPTPTVKWINMNGLNLSDRVVFENANKTLRIPNVVEDDDGEYQCIATNTHGSITHTYYVTVEAAPYWIKKPESQIYAPGETMRLDCEVYGKPKPEVMWRINGIPLEEVMPDPKREVLPGALILRKVQPNDTAVIQCQAQNKHGSILANAYILVVRLPAEILTQDGIVYSVVENQTAILHCETFGAPRPTVKWLTEDMYFIVEDYRSSLSTNGTLKLKEVQRSDAGNFTCLAENDQNNISIVAHLVVKGATQFEVEPTNAEEKKGGSATFHCKVVFDETIPEHGIEWHRKGQLIEESDDNDKYFINETSLTITDLDYSDQGIYSCLAWTTLDSVEKSAKLFVYGNPGPVSNLELSEQQEWQVKLIWTPGDDHNRPIKEYTVFCEENNFGQGKMEWLATVPGNQPWAGLHLSPFRNYYFYVQARNDQGESELSSRSPNYITKSAAPRRNPSDVRGEGNETTNMIITWMPLPHREWNSPALKYLVQWRPKNQGQWDEVEVEHPPVVVTDTPVFSPYEVKVQSRNDFGKGPEPPTTLGYSGEDVPEAIPENIGVEIINSTTIKLSWALLNREKVFGHLKGFKVYYINLRNMAERSRRQARIHTHPRGELKIEGDVSEVQLGGFRPWSWYRVEMTVLNGRGEGPLSEAMEFNTPEGVPSPPASFHLDCLSDTELLLEWTRPKFPNGKLLRYGLKYQPAIQTVNQTKIAPITEISPNRHNYTVSGLPAHIPYKFFLWAETSVGLGDPIILEEHAMRESVNLSFLNISLGDTGENYTTITWTPHPNQRGVEIGVHLMSKTDKEPWHIVGKANSRQGSYSIPDLEPGKQYRVRLVKEHRTGDNQTIWETEVETSGIVRETFQKSFAAEGWFIGFVSAIVLLILVLVLLCFIKRSKGVKDKEDTQVDSEARPMKDETFGEYSDNEEKPFTSSQPSLNGDIKALGSDDSLADYGGSVDVQFNEDGSFIGQYSGHKGKDGGGNDSSGAASPTNVVTALE